MEEVTPKNIKNSTIILENGDELLTLKSGIKVVKSGESYIMEGDILLAPWQVDMLDAPQTKGSAVSDLSRRWSDQTVYYTFDNNLTYTEIISINYAITNIENRTSIRFIPRTTHNDYIKFIKIDGNVSYSSVGKVGGEQVIRLGSFSTGVIIHEIGHALGLNHEHCRKDRDSYIHVHYDNIQPDFAYAFDKKMDDIIKGPFDFNSIMLYTYDSFAIDNSKPTITKKRWFYISC